MGLLSLFKSVIAGAKKVVVPLVSEKRVVHKKDGSAFMETFHVKPGGRFPLGEGVKPSSDPPAGRITSAGKAAAVAQLAAKRTVDLPKGHDVKFKPEGAAYHRTGTIIAVLKDHYKVQGNRTEAGTIPIHKVPKGEVVPLADYKKYVEQPARKTSDKKITADGDRNAAKHNLAPEESIRRKKIVEERLGFGEGAIIQHPSFVGPAIKITSELAKENGITPTVTGKETKMLWHQATDGDHQEMLFAYSLAALKAWRRVLSEPITKDAAGKLVANNVKEFKEVLVGTKKSSYAHMVMQKEGKAAAIQYLQERRAARDRHEDMDYADMEEDPNARKLLERNSSQPMQLKYTLAVNHESMADDMHKMVESLDPMEREIIRMKFGFHPYKEPVNSNEQIADHLNERGFKAPDGNRWHRNNVGMLVGATIGKIRQSSSRDDLAFHYDAMLGRDVWKSQRVPADMHPAGAFTACGIDYTIIHEGDEAVLAKAQRDGTEIDGATFETLIKAIEIDNLKTLYPPFTIQDSSKGYCLLCPVGTVGDDLFKSFSSDLQANHPGGRWITCKEGPLEGRHIFILPHSDGSATVLVGGGPALRHKVLTLRPQTSKEAPAATDQQGGDAAPGPEKEATEGAAPAGAPKSVEAPRQPEMTAEEKTQIDDSIKVLTQEIELKKAGMHDFVKEQWGVNRELTPEEKTRIEKRTEGIENPVERAVAEMQEIKKARKEKDAAVQEIINAAKAALLDENPSAQGNKGIAAVVKENAEVLVGMHMAAKALEKDRKDLRKMVRVGKMNDKFRSGKDILADLSPLTGDEIKSAVSDEKALADELDAHYKLVKMTRGIVGVDRGVKVKGEEEIARNIRQGGFETFTGFIGQLTHNAILPKKAYDALGSANAAILAKHYLKTSGIDMKNAAKDLETYLTAEGSPVAFKANDRGHYFMHLADKVRQFGKGSNNVMTVNQALGTALKYQRKAYEAYGQAEGSLNQGAEFLYAYKGKGDDAIEFQAGTTGSLDRKRKTLGLKPTDVIMKKVEGGHKMVIPPRSFEKMIREDSTFAHGHGLGIEHSADDIKAGKANTDDFHPSGIREYTPPDKNGVSEKLVIPPEKQAAVRLLAQQKKIYLNWEAGTGKSFTMLAAKAHLDDLHGEPQKMIVAMPAKLLANFKDEVEKFTNYKCVLVNDQTPQKRKELYASDPNTIVLVNKEKMNVDAAAIHDAGFNIVAADEAHKITQREGRGNSQMSDGLDRIAQKADYYIAASGTPTPNDLSELYFHAHIMDPKRFRSQAEFMAQFGSAHKGAGYKDAIAEFMNNYLGDRISTQKKAGRSYKFNLHQHHVEMTDSQRKEYKAISEQYRSGDIATFQRDHQLDYLLNAHDHKDNNKFSKVKEIIDGHLKSKAPDEKVIFYAKNRATVNQINDFIAEHYPEYDHVEFTGTTNKKDLDTQKQKFKHDPKTKFSIHMRAGVEGLNMQYDGNGGGATTAIAIASGEDSYAPLDQFFSRADRTGQKKDVDAHLILTDSPHDISTGLRLEEKKAVGELIGDKKRKPAPMQKAVAGLYLHRRKAA